MIKAYAVKSTTATTTNNNNNRRSNTNPSKKIDAAASTAAAAAGAAIPATPSTPGSRGSNSTELPELMDDSFSSLQSEYTSATLGTQSLVSLSDATKNYVVVAPVNVAATTTAAAAAAAASVVSEAEPMTSFLNSLTTNNLDRAEENEEVMTQPRSLSPPTVVSNPCEEAEEEDGGAPTVVSNPRQEDDDEEDEAEDIPTVVSNPCDDRVGDESTLNNPSNPLVCSHSLPQYDEEYGSVVSNPRAQESEDEEEEPYGYDDDDDEGDEDGYDDDETEHKAPSVVSNPRDEEEDDEVTYGYDMEDDVPMVATSVVSSSQSLNLQQQRNFNQARSVASANNRTPSLPAPSVTSRQNRGSQKMIVMKKKVPPARRVSAPVASSASHFGYTGSAADRSAQLQGGTSDSHSQSLRGSSDHYPQQNHLVQQQPPRFSKEQFLQFQQQFLVQQALMQQQFLQAQMVQQQQQQQQQQSPQHKQEEHSVKANQETKKKLRRRASAPHSPSATLERNNVSEVPSKQQHANAQPAAAGPIKTKAPRRKSNGLIPTTFQRRMSCSDADLQQAPQSPKGNWAAFDVFSMSPKKPSSESQSKQAGGGKRKILRKKMVPKRGSAKKVATRKSEEKEDTEKSEENLPTSPAEFADYFNTDKDEEVISMSPLQGKKSVFSSDSLDLQFGVPTPKMTNKKKKDMYNIKDSKNTFKSLKNKMAKSLSIFGGKGRRGSPASVSDFGDGRGEAQFYPRADEEDEGWGTLLSS